MKYLYLFTYLWVLSYVPTIFPDTVDAVDTPGIPPSYDNTASSILFTTASSAASSTFSSSSSSSTVGAPARERKDQSSFPPQESTTSIRFDGEQHSNHPRSTEEQTNIMDERIQSSPSPSPAATLHSPPHTNDDDHTPNDNQDNNIGDTTTLPPSLPRIYFRHPRMHSYVNINERILIDIGIEEDTLLSVNSTNTTTTTNTTTGNSTHGSGSFFLYPAYNLRFCIYYSSHSTAILPPDALINGQCFLNPGPVSFFSAYTYGNFTVNATFERITLTDIPSSLVRDSNASLLLQQSSYVQRLLSVTPSSPHTLIEILSLATTTFQVEDHNVMRNDRWGKLPYMMTRATCNRFSKFRFYLYPVDRLPTIQSAKLYYTLRDSYLRTEDPLQACVYIVISDIHSSNYIGESYENTAARLTRAPYWGNGENHIVFGYGDYYIGFDTQRAVLAQSSFIQGNEPYFAIPPKDGNVLLSPHKILHERKGFDITIPLAFYRCGYNNDTLHLQRYDIHKAVPQGQRIQIRKEPLDNGGGGGGGNGDVNDPSNPVYIDYIEGTRKYLLTFKGSVYMFPEGHPSSVRRSLARLHNNDDILVLLTCWNVSPDCSNPCPSMDGCPPPTKFNNVSTGLYDDCYAAQQLSEQYDFDDLLMNTKFTAIVAGEGTHSYRLYEALQAGAIPVFIGQSARPLEPLINWAEAAIIYEDTSLPGLYHLVNVLRSIPPRQRVRMQLMGRRIFESHLATLSLQLHSMFMLLTHRFDTAHRRIIQEQQEMKKQEELSKLMNHTLTSMDGSTTTISNGTAPDSASLLVGTNDATPAVMEHGNTVANIPSNPPIRSALSTDTHSENEGEDQTTAGIGKKPTTPDASPVPTQAAPTEPLFSTPKGDPREVFFHIVEQHTRKYDYLLERANEAVNDAMRYVYNLQQHLLVLSNASLLAQQIDEVNDDMKRNASYRPKQLPTLSDYGRHVLSASTIQELRSLMQNQDTLYIVNDVSIAINAWLEWLSKAVPHPADRAVPAVRPVVANIYAMLSQAYALLSSWRHSTTAADAVFFFHGNERTINSVIATDTQRLRNAMYDIRRPTQLQHSYNPTFASLMDFHYRLRANLLPVSSGVSPVKIGRIIDAASDADEEFLSGYGTLGFYLASVPLTSIGIPSNILPYRLPASNKVLVPSPVNGFTSGSTLYQYYDMSSLSLPYVLVTDQVLQYIAHNISGSLPVRLSVFQERHRLTPTKALTLSTKNCPSSPSLAAPSDTPTVRRPTNIAIVSLCAYNESLTNLTHLSTENLRQYCDYHGYSCYVASKPFDTRRPIAWSKLLLVAHFLPKHDWVMWKDCDSFFMDREVSVEDLIIAASTARNVIGEVTANVLHDKVGIGKEELYRMRNGTVHVEKDDEERKSQGNPATVPSVPPSPAIPSPASDDFCTIQHDTVTGLPIMKDIWKCARLRSTMERSFVAPSSSSSTASVPSSVLNEPLSFSDPPPSPPSSSSSSSSIPCYDSVPLFNSPIDLIVSEDGLMINTGVWLLRNSPWSLSWLRRTYGDHAPDTLGSTSWKDHIDEFRITRLDTVLSVSDETKTTVDVSTLLDDDTCSPRIVIPSNHTLDDYSKIILNSMQATSDPTVFFTQQIEALPETTLLQIERKNHFRKYLYRYPHHGNTTVIGFPFINSRFWEQGGIFWETAFEGQTVWNLPLANEKDHPCFGTTMDSLTSADCLSFIVNASVSGTHATRFGLDDAIIEKEMTVQHASLPETTCGVPLRAYVDSAHTMYIPQTWINAYPPLIARALEDNRHWSLHHEFGGFTEEHDYDHTKEYGKRKKSARSKHVIQGEQFTELAEFTQRKKEEFPKPRAPSHWSWIISFSGCTSYYTSIQCEELYQKYAEGAAV